jgi:hypothetical protein
LAGVEIDCCNELVVALWIWLSSRPFETLAQILQQNNRPSAEEGMWILLIKEHIQMGKGSPYV